MNEDNTKLQSKIYKINMLGTMNVKTKSLLGRKCNFQINILKHIV